MGWACATDELELVSWAPPRCSKEEYAIADKSAVYAGVQAADGCDGQVRLYSKLGVR